MDGVCYGWGDTMEAERTEAENPRRALSPTHPGQQRLLLSHVVNEAQRPGGTMEASMQAVVQVR